MSHNLSLDYYEEGLKKLSDNENHNAITLFLESFKLSKEKNYECLFCLGIAYENLREFKKAEIYYIMYIKLNTAELKGWINLANLYYQSNSYDQAIETFNMALRSCGTDESLCIGLAEIQIKKGLFNDAYNTYLKIEDKIKNNIDAIKSFVFIYQMLDMYGEAVNLLEEFLINNPHLEQSEIDNLKMVLGWLYLKTENYVEGFALVERRWDLKSDKYILPFDKSYKWDGKKDLTGKTIIIVWEQGLGDTIQFSRFVNYIDAISINIYIFCQDELYEIFKISFPNINISKNINDLPRFDYFIPIMSIPFLFGINVHSYNFVQYLKPTYYKGRASKSIGIAWEGNKSSFNDQCRSIEFDLIKKHLLIDKSFHWHCLQYGFDDLQSIFDSLLPKKLDFLDLANLILKFDLVITVDTSVAHLAGAIGMPTWLLLPKNSCWRWGKSEKTTFWYNNIKIFKQKVLNDWDSVLKDVLIELNKLYYK